MWARSDTRMASLNRILSYQTCASLLLLFVFILPQILSTTIAIRGKDNAMTPQSFTKDASATTVDSSPPYVSNTSKTNHDISHAYFIIVFNTPTGSFWIEDRLEVMGLTLTTFFNSLPIFHDFPVTMDTSIGDTFNILSGRNYSAHVEEGVKTFTETHIISVKMSVPRFKDEFYDDAIFGIFIEETIFRFNGLILSLFSQELNYDLFAHGVDVKFVVLTESQTFAPTFGPTFSLHLSEEKRKMMEKRSWVYVSFLWIIVLACFALENGLCADKLCRWKYTLQGSSHSLHMD